MTSACEFTEGFKSAAADYLFLLENHYPQKSILKLVGDRYALSGVERTMLYRGISSGADNIKRLKKVFRGIPSSRIHLHIDAYNVLLTIGSYLNGSKVFIALDGYLRDASEIHGKAFRKELLDRSLELLLAFILSSKIKHLSFYIDRPVSYSGDLSQKINGLLDQQSLKGEATLHDSADFVLKRIEKGICATSDSAIIEHSLVPVYDLARKTLDHHFNPLFTDLRKLF
jgi:hypothetical protein